MENITVQLRAFIVEADELADAFSVSGLDDNSYDADGLAREAEEIIQQLANDEETPDAAVRWLTAAKMQLGNIR